MPTSCVALIGDSERGRYWSCVDTPQNSASQVEAYRHKGWFGCDEKGEFNQSPADFEYPMLSQWDPFAWSESLELASGEDFEYEFVHVLEDGEKYAAGAAELDKYVHDLLVQLLTKFQHSAEFNMMTKIEPFRLGVWMVDSVNQDFWLLEEVG